MSYSARELADKLREIANEVEALETKPHMLDIPYRSQHDADAQLSRADCGPACVAMLVEWKGGTITVDGITALTGTGPTDSIELTRAALVHGISLMRVNNAILSGIEAQIDSGKPVVALVRYADFGKFRQDTQYAGLHWVVVVGYDSENIYIHDPNHWGARRNEGKAKAIPRAMFDFAWGDTMPEAINRQMLVVV